MSGSSVNNGSCITHGWSRNQSLYNHCPWCYVNNPDLDGSESLDKKIQNLEEKLKNGANSTQHGGTHYKEKPVQPWDYIAANKLGYFEGNVVKYVSRWRDKGGVEDLRKARHYLDKLIELETRDAGKTN